MLFGVCLAIILFIILAMIVFVKESIGPINNMWATAREESRRYMENVERERERKRAQVREVGKKFEF
jgi:hypothetical protein